MSDERPTESESIRRRSLLAEGSSAKGWWNIDRCGSSTPNIGAAVLGHSKLDFDSDFQPTHHSKKS